MIPLGFTPWPRAATNLVGALLLSLGLALTAGGAMRPPLRPAGASPPVAANPNGGPRPRPPRRKAGAKPDEIEAGERLFRRNCGRCHTPPEDLSPRAAAAVVRQMRIRGLLPAADARLILLYFRG